MDPLETDDVDAQKPHFEKNIRCANCDVLGHRCKDCTLPIASYGLVCYRRHGGDDELEYVLVQRKDTISYVEFVRGKYDSDDAKYLGTLFSRMTREEKRKIECTASFDVLWQGMWQQKDARDSQGGGSRATEYANASKKFEALKSSGRLAELLARDESLPENEWGFPKGRRAINEVPYTCALREFREETGLNCRLDVEDASHTFTETFSGTNGVVYQHTYYLAECRDADSAPSRYRDVREIKDVRWFKLEDAVSKLTPYRRDILNAIDARLRDRPKK